MNLEEGRPLRNGWDRSSSWTGGRSFWYSKRFHACVAGTSAVLVVLLGIATWLTYRASPENAGEPGPQIPTARLSSGYDMPLLGMGTVAIQGDNGTAAVKAALQMGYTHIDTAGNYGSEEYIGRALTELINSGTIKREDVFITTKLETEQHAREAVEPALRESLQKLQLNWVDLYLVHWPITDKPGPTLQPPMEETWEGMQDVADKGLTRSIGVSNMSPEKINMWFGNARIFPAVNQIEVHPNWRNDRVLDYDREHNIHTTAYMPLSSPGTMQNINKTVPNLMQDSTVQAIAQRYGKTPAQVLLRWGLQHGTSVIPKSDNPVHLKENLGALGWELNEEDFTSLSTFQWQERYLSGAEWGYISPEGPWHTAEELWDQP